MTPPTPLNSSLTLMMSPYLANMGVDIAIKFSRSLESECTLPPPSGLLWLCNQGFDGTSQGTIMMLSAKFGTVSKCAFP